MLGQGKVIDALRLAKNLPDGDIISARKFLEAAQKSNDALVFHSVFTFFQMRNLRQRGSADFLKSIILIRNSWAILYIVEFFFNS